MGHCSVYGIWIGLHPVPSTAVERVISETNNIMMDGDLCI